MTKERDLSRLFAKGQALETAVGTSSLFSQDGGLHLTSYKVQVDGKTTVIDNLSIYGSVILILESKNFSVIQGEEHYHFWRGRGVRRYFSIPNPLDQNLYHAKILSRYLITKGIKSNQFKIETYVIVPDSCKIEVDEKSRKSILGQTDLVSLKQKHAFYNSTENAELNRVIKEGLF